VGLVWPSWGGGGAAAQIQLERSFPGENLASLPEPGFKQHYRKILYHLKGGKGDPWRKLNRARRIFLPKEPPKNLGKAGGKGVKLPLILVLKREGK